MDTKVFSFPESGNNDLATLLALNNGGCGNGLGGWGGGFLGFLLGILLGNNGNGLWGNRNGNNVDELVLGGLSGRMSDIQTLATTMNTDINQISNALNTIQTAIQQVGAQNGMGFLQVTNATQAGDAAIVKQLCECCCENRLLTTQLGYENRIQTIEQTNQLGGQADRNTRSITDAIAAQSAMITKEFCELKEREMQAHIDALTAENSTLKSNINNSAQTAQIAAMIAPLQGDILNIKGKLPETVTLPWSPATAVPTSYVYNQLYSQYNGGSIWS